MIKVTPELAEAMDEFEERFPGDIVPLQMMPAYETNEGLIQNIKKCLDQNKNLLHEIYKWKLDGSVIY